MGTAPSLHRLFSAMRNTFKFWFWLSATPIHSPPSGPKSLSLSARESNVLLRIRRAAMHTAPYMPKEFLRIEVSSTPRSKCFKEVFAIRSSKSNSRPSPEIMLEARFMLTILVCFCVGAGVTPSVLGAARPLARGLAAFPAPMPFY